MKQRTRKLAIVWALTLKRLAYTKSLWVVVLLVPVLLLGIQLLEKDTEQGLTAAVYAEDSFWRDYITSDEKIAFYFVETLEQLKTEVLKGNAECGYVLSKNLLDSFARDDWYWEIEVYESADSMFTKLINEVVFSRIFQVVSTDWYLEYMESLLKETKSDVSTEQIVQALSQDLLGEETFHVETIRVDSLGQITTDEDIKEEAVKGKDAGLGNTGSLLSGKGVVAALVYLTSLLAVMQTVRDRERGYFPLKLRCWAALWTIFNPTVLVAFVGLVGLWITEANFSVSRESFALLGLSVLATLYGMVLSVLVRRERLMYGVIPALFVACLVCCPVFVDLGSVVPVLNWIEKLFPVAFYL